MMLLNTVSTMTSECFLVRSDTRETSSTSSAFVMLPPFICCTPEAISRQLTAFSLPSALGCQPSGFWPRADNCELTAVLPVPKVIPQRRRAVAGALLIRLPVGAELVRLQRPD